MGSLADIEGHELACDFMTVECENRGCDHECATVRMPEHARSCPFRPQECHKCGARMTQARMKRHDCTREMLSTAMETMSQLERRVGRLEAVVTDQMANMAQAMDRRMAAMTLKMERMHAMLHDRLSQSKERNEILETHDEIMHVGRAYRLKSHRGKFVCPQPTPGVLAPPSEGHWTCCRQKQKVTWCLVPPEEYDE